MLLGIRFFKIVGCLFFIFIVGCDNKHEYYQGYAEGVYSYLASAIGGNLTQALAVKGDQVKVNQPLFVLDPQPEYAKLQQAQNELNQAEQNLYNEQKGARGTVIAALEARLAQEKAVYNLAAINYKRYQTLYHQSAIDKLTFDQATNNYEQSQERIKELSANLAEAKLGAREHLVAAQEATVAAAEAEVKQAEWALLQKSIRAPEAGQITDKLYQIGEYVPAARPVLVLLPSDKIKLVFFVPEKKLATVKIGASVEVSCDSCKKIYSAKISYVSPSAEYTPPIIFSESSRDKLVYRIEALPSPQDATDFHPGQPVEVKF